MEGCSPKDRAQASQHQQFTREEAEECIKMDNPIASCNTISASLPPRMARRDRAQSESRSSQASNRTSGQAANNGRVHPALRGQPATPIGPGAFYATIASHNPSSLRRTIDRENARQVYMAAQRVSPPGERALPPRIGTRVSSRGSTRSPPPQYRVRAHSEEQLPSYELPPEYGSGVQLPQPIRASTRRPSANSWEAGDVAGVDGSSYRRLPQQTPLPHRRARKRRRGCGSFCCNFIMMLGVVISVIVVVVWATSKGDTDPSSACELNEELAFTCRNRGAAPLCFGDSLIPFDPSWLTDEWQAFESYGGAILACKAHMNFEGQEWMTSPKDFERARAKQWMWKCQEAKCTGQDCSEFKGVCVSKTEDRSSRQRFEDWNEKA